MKAQQVAVGKFGCPYGVRGWIKVISFTHPIDNILTYLPWYISKEGQQVQIDKIIGQLHGQHLIVQIPGCQDRDLAKTYTNVEIFINRDQLPPPAADEQYWVDLVGLSVQNKEQQELGKVDSIFATGANDVLIVIDKEGKERYIPYIADVIVDVDLNNKMLQVDWDSDF